MPLIYLSKGQARAPPLCSQPRLPSADTVAPTPPLIPSRFTASHSLSLVDLVRDSYPIAGYGIGCGLSGRYFCHPPTSTLEMSRLLHQRAVGPGEHLCLLCMHTRVYHTLYTNKPLNIYAHHIPVMLCTYDIHMMVTHILQCMFIYAEGPTSYIVHITCTCAHSCKHMHIISIPACHIYPHHIT